MNYLIALSDHNLSLLLHCLSRHTGPDPQRQTHLAGVLEAIAALGSEDYFLTPDGEWYLPRFLFDLLPGGPPGNN